MGLDPPTLVSVSEIFRELAYKSSPRLIMSLRPQDPIPDWITHLVILGHHYKLALAGPKEEVLFAVHRWSDAHTNPKSGTVAKMAAMMTERYGQPLVDIGHTLSTSGISPYVTYSRIMSSESPKYIRPTGEMEPGYLDSANKKLWQNAAEKPRERAQLDDLLALTCLLPAAFNRRDAAQDSPDKKSSVDQVLRHRKATLPTTKPMQHTLLNPLIELNNIVVSYGAKTVLGQGIQSGFSDPGLNLIIRQGTRLALLGPNGSGKTTLLSLLTSDHPQSYSLPIKYFGRSRLPSPGQAGLSIWEIQSRIGHSSPEIHNFFPRRLTIRQSLESAWSDTFAAKPTITTETKRLVDAFLRWWEPELNPRYLPLAFTGPPTTPIDDWVSTSYPPFKHSSLTANELDWASSSSNTFGVLAFQSQRLLLFLRALIKKPDIVILDEAFSGLSPEIRDKAMLFLRVGEGLMLRRPQTPVQGPSGNNGNHNVPEGSSSSTTLNHRLDVEDISKKEGITTDDLLVGKEKLKHGARKKVYRLRAMSLVQLRDTTVYKGHHLGYAFTGLNPQQALIVVSHVREEIPNVVNEFMRLPGEEEVREQGRVVESGRCEDIMTVEGWNKIWA